MATTYVFDVQMSCGGCVPMVTKAVNAIPNITFVEASVEKQQASVVAQDGVSYDHIKMAITNVGKKVISGRTIVNGQIQEMA